ncbi:hypothetical protein RUM43_006757 [Polyplax serrata]|uniref:Chloride channel CLIC-like protein 1 n=1 Tax=Polyplax serrata TaxID=468196 RepID=A0AAN8S533_POLSC
MAPHFCGFPSPIFIVLLICIFTVLTCLQNYKNIHVEQVKESGSYSKNLDNTEYDDIYSHEESDVSDIYLDELYSSPEDSIGKDKRLLNNYVQRYVSLFLKISELEHYNVINMDDSINVDFMVTISGSDLAFLQNFSKTRNSVPVHRKLSRIDNIFVNVLKLKESNIFKNGIGDIVQVITSIYQYITTIGRQCFSEELGNPSIVIFFTTVLVAYICSPRRSSLSGYGLIFSGINALISYEAYRKQMILVPECNKPWYSWFSTAHCDEQPVEAQVSLLECFIDKYYYYYIECPIKLYTSTLSVTAGQITDGFHWIAKPFATVAITLLLFIIACIACLVLYGIALKVSFFGCSFQLKSQPVQRNDNKVLTNAKDTIKAIDDK